MDRYEMFLKKLTKTELKTIVKSLLKHVEIKLTGIKKEDLINHLLKHTMYEDGSIVLKEEFVDLNLEDIVSDLDDKLKKDALTDKQIKDKKEKTLKEIGKISGMITNKERTYNDLVFESILPGGKNKDMKELNPTEKMESDKLSNEIESHKKKLKILRMQLKALRGYKTGIKEDKKEEVKKKEVKKKEVKKKEAKKMEAKKMEDEEYEGDDEFKKKKKLVGLRARFDRLKKELQDETDMKKKKLLESQIEQVRDEFNNLRKN